MPIKHCDYFDPNEPPDHAEVRRYLTMFKFQDFAANEELYFARPDTFSDNAEGIPSESRVAGLSGMTRIDLFDLTRRREIDNLRGSFAQFRERYFISCWTLHTDETCRIWHEYAWDKKADVHGVAIQTNYGRLKAELEKLPEDINVGKVMYGKEKLIRPGNDLCEITSKDKDFSWESEIRALLHWPSALSGGNLHIGADNRPHPSVLDENPRYHWNHDHKRRRIDLTALATGIIISPWASQEVIDEVKLWASLKKHIYPVIESPLKSPLLPTHAEYLEREHVWKAAKL